MVYIKSEKNSSKSPLNSFERCTLGLKYRGWGGLSKGAQIPQIAVSVPRRKSSSHPAKISEENRTQTSELGWKHGHNRRRDQSSSRRLFARLPGFVRRAGDGGVARRRRARGEGCGRSVASGDAGVPVCEGGAVSRAGLLARPAAVSNAAEGGKAEGSRGIWLREGP